MSFQELLGAVEKETECINELLSYITQQRDAVINKDLEAVQDLMKLLHSSSLKVYKYETLRDKAATSVAAEFNCMKNLSDICEALGEEGEQLRSSGEKLEKAVKMAGSESKILKRLLEEGQKYNEMMLSEIRRLEGIGFSGGSSMDITG